MGRVEMLSVGCETTCCPRGNLRAICIANLTFLLFCICSRCDPCICSHGKMYYNPHCFYKMPALIDLLKTPLLPAPPYFANRQRLSGYVSQHRKRHIRSVSRNTSNNIKQYIYEKLIFAATKRS